MLVVIRLGHWLRTRKRELPPWRIVRELQTTLALTALLCLLACFWTINLITDGSPEVHDLVILFASLASIGCAYGLSSFAAAGRLPLVLFALPFSAALVMSPNPAHGVVGISLAAISMLTLRLLDLHNRGLLDLVRSRVAVDAERDRAVRAEHAAIAEQERVRNVADTDALTGLPNRRAFIKQLTARIDARSAFCLLLVDLDGFKPINDVFGHATGDAVLIEVARRLKRICRRRHIAARMGGDEFSILIDFSDTKPALALARSIIKDIGRTIWFEGRAFNVSASGGLMRADPEIVDAASALRFADAALYAGKERGRGKVALFTPRLRRASSRRVRIELELRKSETLRQLRTSYQPIFCLDGGKLVGFEALARWSHPELGEISPAEFIPIAEQINLIEKISDALLRRSAREARDWPQDIFLSFNLSAVQLGSTQAAQRILSLIRSEGLEPNRIMFEVTETSLLANFDQARRNLRDLRLAGSRIAIDDFGAGFASISYLSEIQFDVLKIDGSLVIRAAECPHARDLLAGVVSLCRSLRLSCVGESVENDAQLKILLASSPVVTPVAASHWSCGQSARADNVQPPLTNTFRATAEKARCAHADRARIAGVGRRD